MNEFEEYMKIVMQTRMMSIAGAALSIYLIKNKKSKLLPTASLAFFSYGILHSWRPLSFPFPKILGGAGIAEPFAVYTPSSLSNGEI